MSQTPPSSARILVVEDDPSILLGLRMNLEKQGYEIKTAADGVEALELLGSGEFDRCILDVMMPQLNGYEVLRQLGPAARRVPVLVLSARTHDEDKVLGLDLGAEDYITKPFSVPELLARVRAALRRHQPQPERVEPTLEFGAVSVNPATREVTKGGTLVELTVTEFDVLFTLAGAAGRALSRKDIYEAVWGKGHHGTHRTVDNFVGQLRHKLEDDPRDPQHLLTVRGIGYRLA